MSRQRIVIASHISNKTTREELASFIKDLNCPELLIVSSSIENSISPEKTSLNLGEEYDGVIFDARDKFYPNALGIVSGVLRSGGMLVIFLPDKKDWLEWNSSYMLHFKNFLDNRDGVYYIDKDNKQSESFRYIPACVEIPDDVQSPYKNIEQKETVDELIHLISTESDVCVVLTSGRGRGKTSSLGLLVAKLTMSKNYNVLISAPRKSITEPFFKHLLLQCPDAQETRYGYEINKSSIDFIAPDALLRDTPEADVLLIDEAAAIPLPMLKDVLRTYRKVIFSSTTHGYEGTGRGFVLKFYNLLNEWRPAWVKMELHQPIRWARNDYLESWIEDVLFLKAKSANISSLPEQAQDCQFELEDRQLLIDDENKISSIFSLLVSAHYRTSPADFQYLLDDNNVRIYSLSYMGNILGVLAISEEGGFASSLSTDIYRGERRPKGHLLAQTLCFHAGYESAAELKYARVMRIAIHPDAQQQGIGSYFIQQVIKQERAKGIDIFGSSFSATFELLKFWKKAGISILRFGFSRDHVTTSHAVVVGMGLSEKGKIAVDILASKFERNFEVWEKGALSSLPEAIKNYLHNNIHRHHQRFSKLDILDVESFANHNRNYEACMPSINRLISEYEYLPEKLNRLEKDIVLISSQYTGDWEKIVNCMKLSGKGEAVTLLRLALRILLEDYKNRHDI